jgi:hypothetical protein
MYGAFPQSAGVGAPGLVDQSALPPWLTGGTPQGQAPGPSHGMQARSLVDEQALPEWLRKQPDEQPRPTVAGWLGASAAEEPLPAWITPAHPDAAGRGQMGVPHMNGAPQGAYSPHFSTQGMPDSWQAPAFGAGAQPISEDLALPDWLQAQAAGGAPNPGPGVAPRTNSPYQWDGDPRNASPLQAPQAAASSAFMGEADVAPTMRTPNAPTWGAEPAADGFETDGSRGWNAANEWDDGQPGASENDWSESNGRGAPRGAPLSLDEMPPWLRRSAGPGGAQAGAGSERAARGRKGAAEDGSRRDQSERDFGAWEDDQGWDDGYGGWDDQGRGPDAGRDAAWDDNYDASPAQDPRDAWGAGSRRPDPYDGRGAREDDGWGRGDTFSTGYGESMNPYAGQGNGFDGRSPGMPYDPYPDDDYYGAEGGYDDAMDDQPRGRKGWKGFFRRGE